MGLSVNDGPHFVPATSDDKVGFTADASPLAHYVSFGPGVNVGTVDDPEEQKRRREALERLIAGAF